MNNMDKFEKEKERLNQLKYEALSKNVSALTFLSLLITAVVCYLLLKS